MTEHYKKKLIEVAIPLDVINAASSREKSIRHGHPSTLHLWWARRPLATCRAILFAQLVDDPSSHPDQFSNEEAVENERKRLFGIIEDLVKWENSTNQEIIERARIEIRKSYNGELPPVYDPFSGGGSIPLEAQRLGLPAYGSDLNPIAVMIGKAMIEIPNRFKNMEPVHPGTQERNHYCNAEGLAEDVRYYGEWMRQKAYERIGHLYPKVELPKEYGGGKATVIAWIWAQTVPSPDPAFSDIEVPLISSFLLSSKAGREAWIKPVIDRQTKKISFRIRQGGTKAELDQAKLGTTAGKRQAFRCIMSGTALSYKYIRNAGKSGKIGKVLIAIVAEGKRGRAYVEPLLNHTKVANSTSPKRKPYTQLPVKALGINLANYGKKTFGDLFEDRQLIALNTFSDLVHEARALIELDALSTYSTPPQTNLIPLSDGGSGARAYAEAVSVYLGFIVDKCSDYWSTSCSWNSSGQKIRNTFGRQAIPVVWDFAEANPFSDSSGNWIAMRDWVWKTIANFFPAAIGAVIQHDAQSVIYPERVVISSDPPYYDNIGYADLSDFFFCWAKPSLKPVYPHLFEILATPKSEELIANPYRHGGKETAGIHFLSGMRHAIANMAQHSSNSAPTTIYYAFKQSEIQDEGISSTGWATFLQAVVEAGYIVVGTWPLRTEMASRMRAHGSNALANSVVLVCRKRNDAAETITRAEFIRALKVGLPSAIKELQAANIAPADMPQSAIGPGMGIFSRYKAVLEATDHPMLIKTALQLINKVLDDFLNDIQGEFDSETRFTITWFEQYGNDKGEYGIANSIAQARGISVESVKHAGIVESAAGSVRILKRDDLPENWTPEGDKHLTIWECCQYLIRTLEKDGEDEAATLQKRIGSDKAEAAKDLAYCLYDICSNKRNDAKEATSYNGLIAVWSDLTRIAASVSLEDINEQTTIKF